MKTINVALRKQIADRIKLVKKIARFVLETTQKHGTVTSEEMGQSHVHVKMALFLGELTFFTNTGQTMMGGHTVTICHPDEDDTRFRLHWETDMEDENGWTLRWEPDTDWLHDVNRLMKRGAVQKKLDALKRRKEYDERRTAKDKRDAAEREALKRKARSLGLTPEE